MVIHVTEHDIVYGGRALTNNALALALKRTFDSEFAYAGYTFSSTWTQHFLHPAALMRYMCALRRGEVVQPTSFKLRPFQFDFLPEVEVIEEPVARRASSECIDIRGHFKMLREMDN